MNNKKRKAEKESAQDIKLRRDQVQDQILNKARPFIGTKSDAVPVESQKKYSDVNSSDGSNNKKPPKRKKQPKAKKVKKSKAPTPQVPSEEQNDRALVYLKAWHTKEEGWKFSKKMQIWLIRNMYTRKQVSDEDFPIILEYLDTLTGPTREQVVTQAEDIFRECEAKMEKSGSEIPESCKVNYDRARQVLQML